MEFKSISKMEMDETLRAARVYQSFSMYTIDADLGTRCNEGRSSRRMSSS